MPGTLIDQDDISFRSHSTIDSFDVWRKLHLPSAAYDSLLAKMSSDMEDQNFVSRKKNTSISVKKRACKSSDFPSDWPSPEINPPDWFDQGHAADQVQCTQWDVQLEDRAKGWYWLYDPKSETLRTWEWNRQHFKVR